MPGQGTKYGIYVGPFVAVIIVLGGLTFYFNIMQRPTDEDGNQSTEMPDKGVASITLGPDGLIAPTPPPTPSGTYEAGIPGQDSVVIETLRTGQGQGARAGDTVAVNYVGSLQDGQVFDSNKGKSPLSVQLGAGHVIVGWEQGLLGMKEKEIRRLVIPPHLGYGSTGVPGVISPDSTLIFEVELIKIN